MNISAHPDNLNKHKAYIQLLKTIDTTLAKLNYTKVELPTLSPMLIPESYLEVFQTEYKYMDEKHKLYLLPSPELYLKRLIASGIGSCYSLSKCYRNSEAPSSRHLSEFMMLELYKVQATYFDVAADMLTLFREIAKALYGKDSFTYKGKEILLTEYEKLTVQEAFSRYAHMDDIWNHDRFFNDAKEKGYLTNGFSYSDIWSQIYAQEVEPNLGKQGKPTMLYEYPRELAAVVEFDTERQVANRLEIYIEGLELGNCGTEVSEKTDFNELEGRLKDEDLERKKTDKIQFPPDTEFINVLKKMPKTSGIAIGVERLAMLFTDSESIQDLQLISYEM